MKKLQKLWCLTALLATGTFFLAGFDGVSVFANNTPQTLPFSQNWTNAALITVDDNWSGVPGIVGYRGDDLNITIGADLRIILADGSATPVDVNANRSDPDVFATGGVVEFDGIPNPVVAFQGSATADVPHIVIYLNTTGQSNIQVSYNARDIDNGTGVDAVQQINTQFRVGGAGDYANVTGGYIADASSPGGATLVTPVNVTLPAAANNQALVEVRIMTVNATGSDEFIGIDDINVTGSPVGVTDAPVDFNGDGKTDYAVVRNVGGGPAGQVRWFYNLNATASTTVALDWGLAGDFFVPEDFDGDGKDDITVWRPGAPTVAAFYILNSATSTARVERFGQTGDDPTVVGDYGGDERADLAVYRSGAATGQQSTWFYRSTPGGPVSYVPWGAFGDFEAPGDYNGDGKYDFAVQRAGGGGQGQFWILNSAGAISVTPFGLASDAVVPGDYDGDGKTDIATARAAAGAIQWHYLSSLNGSIVYFTFGNSTGDIIVQGQYDGDNKTDPAVWDQASGTFISLNSTNGAATFFRLGSNGDYPPANYNQH